jgi:EAL domain-containing protein (putative c-di-GMP-specific phosphodiesterase class I)
VTHAVDTQTEPGSTVDDGVRPDDPAADHLADAARVLDGRLVRAVFQPIVHLDSGRVIAYEALARGPVGSPFEAPLPLLAAAAELDRLAELDWICRAAAMRTAVAAGMDRSVCLFLNIEPTALGTPCPTDLVEDIERGQSRLRVVAEMTERALVAQPALLLAEVARCRAIGWGVAIDDVGAEPESLTIMPFVAPEIIKLDLRLVQQLDSDGAAAVALAARAETERTGGGLLAEGIETPEHADIARVLGATYGQGWFYGRPADLPDFTTAVASEAPPAMPGLAVPAAGHDVPTTSGTRTRPDLAATPFTVISAVRRPVPAEKRHLLAMSHQLEDHAAGLGSASVLLSTFQGGANFTPATKRRYERLVPATSLLAAIGVGLPEVPLVGVRGANLSETDPLREEWDVVVVGPHYAAALTARDRGDTGPDRHRRFDYVITHDRDLVLEAARTLLRVIAPIC